MKIYEELLNQSLKEMINKKNVFSAVLCVESGDHSFSWVGAAGDMQKDSQYFISSVTKLYVTAVVMRLVEEGKLKLVDNIEKYLPSQYIQGLHVLKGIDNSHDITIFHLISNTSGLPDYFFHKHPDGKSSASQLLEGKDEPWHLEKTIETLKKLTPNFKPGKKGKASYSDTNYQLLGGIIERITEKNIDEVFKEYIFDELNLQHTYVFKDITDNSPIPFYYKSKKL
jgi:D-alanyl-D-alanine carboxypeptidase